MTTRTDAPFGLDPRALAVLGKVLLAELREIAQRMSDYAGNPSYVKLSGRLDQTLHVCDLAGYSGVRSYLQVLVRLAQMIEAEHEELPRAITVERVRALHAAITSIGVSAKTLQNGKAPDYTGFKEALRPICVLLNDSETPSLFAPSFPSIELETDWQPKTAASVGLFTATLPQLSNAAARVAGDPSPAAVADLVDTVQVCGSSNPHRELQQLFDLLQACSSEGFVLRDSESLSRLLFELSQLSDSVRRGEDPRLPPPAMSAALGLLADLVSVSREGLLQDLANKEPIASMAALYGMDAGLRGDPEVYRKYLAGTIRFESLWARDASSGSAVTVAKHADAFAQGAGKLNNPVYSTLADALRDAACAKDAGTSYAFWLNGAMALLMMRAAVESQRMADFPSEQELAHAIAQRLREGSPVHAPLRACRLLSSQSKGYAISAVFKTSLEILSNAERTVEAMLYKRALQGSVADPAGVTQTTGERIACAITPLVGVYQLLDLPVASAAAQNAVDRSRDVRTWTYDDDATALFTQLAALSLFAGRIRPGDLQDMGGSLPGCSLNQEDFTAQETEPAAETVPVPEAEPASDRVPEVESVPERVPVLAPVVLFMDMPEDPEMSQVFLREALGIIASVAPLLKSALAAPGTLTEEDFILVRRGFHTLKGSGLTIGLTHCSKAAEAVQATMDAWAGRLTMGALPATPAGNALLDLCRNGMALFKAWLHLLQTKSFVSAPANDLEHLLEQATRATSLALAELGAEIETDPMADLMADLPVAIGTRDFVAETAPRQEPGEEATCSAGPADAGWDAAFMEAEEAPVLDAESLLCTIKARFDEATDEIDFESDLLGVLLPEAAAGLALVQDCMAALGSEAAAQSHVTALGRAVHGLKGALRTVGGMKVGAVLHALEDDLSFLVHGNMTRERLSTYEFAFDLVTQALSVIEAGYCAPPQREAVSERVTPAAEVSVSGLAQSAERASVFLEPRSAPAPHRVTGVVPVEAHLLERIGQHSGETVVLQGLAVTEIAVASRGLKELSLNVDRLADQMKQLMMQSEIRVDTGNRPAESRTGYDALEMDRYTALQELVQLMAENVEDIRGSEAVLALALAGLSETEARKGSLSHDLLRETSRLMVVTLSSRKSKMLSTVRLAARDAQKQVELDFDGDAEVPSAVMAKLAPAIDHVLRNAVAHGIESPAARQLAKKPVAGKVSIRVTAGTEKTVIVIQDDGAGIDKEAVLAKARERGLASGRSYSDQEIFDFLFLSGFSTASTVTELAGRGVGLDAVRSALQEVGGEVFVSATEGQGTQFRIEAPTDITSLSVIPITAQGYACLVPSSLIERIVPVPATSAAAAARSGFINIDGFQYRYMRMNWLVAEETTPSSKPYAQLLLCGTASGAPTAFEVEEAMVGRKVLVRPLGRNISSMSGLIAGTTLSDGSVSLIVNPLRMRVIGQDLRESDTRPAVPLVMVVDDSSTVRLYTTRFLRKHGYEVVEACDGIDALEVLRHFTPDLLLLDVEMPRMGGFELATALRANHKFAGIPAVMITSRTAQKHRDHAARLGVSDYIGKPFEETELLAVLAKYLKPTAVRR